MHRDVGDDGTVDTTRQGYTPAQFCFAYGSSKDDSNRGKKITGGSKNDYTNYINPALNKKVQPFVKYEASIGGTGKFNEKFETKVSHPVNGKELPFLLSLTDSFDYVYWNFISSGKDNDLKKQMAYYYIFEPYLHKLDNAVAAAVDNPGPLAFVNLSDINAKYLPGELDYRVIISPELKIPDNKGASNSAEPKRPVTDTNYVDIYVQGQAHKQEDCFNYWDSFINCTRTIDGKTVDIGKEIKE